MLKYFPCLLLLTVTACAASIVEVDVTPEILAAKVPDDDPIAGASVFILTLRGVSDFAFCNGVQLRPGTVLTAAHCVDGEAPRFVGTSRFAANGTVVPVKRIIRHPSKDLALVLVAGERSELERSIAVASPADQGSALAMAAFAPPTHYKGHQLLLTRYPVSADGLRDGLASYKTTQPAMQGESGSGIYLSTRSGPRLVGILSKLSGAGGYVFATALAGEEAWLGF